MVVGKLLFLLGHHIFQVLLLLVSGSLETNLEKNRLPISGIFWRRRILCAPSWSKAMTRLSTVKNHVGLKKRWKRQSALEMFLVKEIWELRVLFLTEHGNRFLPSPLQEVYWCICLYIYIYIIDMYLIALCFFVFGFSCNVKPIEGPPKKKTAQSFKPHRLAGRLWQSNTIWRVCGNRIDPALLLHCY